MIELPTLVKEDIYLEPYADIISVRHKYYQKKRAELLCGHSSLREFASGHLFYGLHFQNNEWIFREWAPNAKQIFLIGEFNDWTISW